MKPHQLRQLGVGILLLITLIFGIRFLWSSNDEYSPEEINSLLQGKDEETVRIKKIELVTQKLKKPFIEPNSYKIKNWELKGNTIIKNNDFVRLTSDNQHQVGSMFSTLPIQAESFEMELTFHIHSKNAMMADGLGIWFIDEKSEIGDVFGVKNYFKGLGIMIDTFKNGKRGQFPLVNVMLGNGQTGYDKALDGYDTRLASCVAQLITNPKSGSTKARIVYIKNGYFSLDFDYNNNNQWTNCVTLNDIMLPPIKYLGLSSETGEVTQNVDILENKVFALYKPEGSFIESIEELQQMMEDTDDIKNDPQHKNPIPSKKTRKSISRLKKAEQRIKENTRKRNKEQYGHEDANIFTYILRQIWTFIKYLLVILLVIMAGWFGFIIFRISRDKKKPRTTGLLD